MSEPTSSGLPRDFRGRPAYRFGFVLNTTIGNMTRYLNLRKYAEHDPEIEFTWAPVNHYTPPDFPSRLRFLPGPLFMRARVLQQAQPVMGRLAHFDAVMIHLFEAEVLTTLRSYWRRGPLRISSTDEAPIVDRSTYPLYPSERDRPVWRQRLRLALDRWRVRRMDYFIPFSQWVGNILVRGCDAPADRVYPMHVGLDLDAWPYAERPVRAAGDKVRLLFVGADFVRKGGDLLIDVFVRDFQQVAELHLVTRQAPATLPPGVHRHDDLNANDPRLARLYAECDLLVVPTTADTGPLWVFMEAMATGLPIIGTDTGSNTELVRHGETGLVVEIGNAASLTAALRTLIGDPALRARMGRNGRALIERRYSARVNVPLILARMKTAVDRARAAAASR